MFDWLRQRFFRNTASVSQQPPAQSEANATTGASPALGSPFAPGEEPLAEGTFVYISMPGRIEPLKRGELYEDPLTVVLEAQGLGEVTGGGSWLSEPDEEGRRFVVSAGIDLDIYDRLLRRICG